MKTTAVLSKDTNKALLQMKLDKDLKSVEDVIKLLLENYGKKA